MADGRLLEWADAAERMARFCEGIIEQLEAADIAIDTQMGRLWPLHAGSTPQQLRSEQNVWRDKILDNLPGLDTVVSRCYEQAGSWRNEYAQQQAQDAATATKAANGTVS